jgi:hypothetical protein
MEIQGQTSSDPSGIKGHVQVFYQHLFNIEGPKIEQINPSVWKEGEKASSEENEALTVPFSEEEIKMALFQMNGTKIPGPDGLPIIFYWHF